MTTIKLAMTMAVSAVVFVGSRAQAVEVSPTKPTIILVHGAFAGSSSWNPVISELQHDGYLVIAAANPLRLAGDGDYVARLVKSVAGPVVLVGHSYGGEVITVAAAVTPNIRSLVFVAGLAPETGESAASLGGRFPTGTLGETLTKPVPQENGAGDIYIDQGTGRRSPPTCPSRTPSRWR